MLFVWVLLFAVCSAHYPLVKELENILTTNDHLRSLILESFALQGHGPDSSEPWTLEGLYDWFDNFTFFLPPPQGTWVYDSRLGATARTVPGREAMTSQIGMDWLRRFLLERGVFLWSTNSTATIPQWMTEPAINMSQYIVPEGGYTSFNNFFARHVKPDERPISDKDNNLVAVSPCDGLVDIYFNNIQSNLLMTVKEQELNVSTLVGDRELASLLVGGKGVLFYLNGFNYHRWHSPVTGRIIRLYKLGGIYWDDWQNSEYWNILHRGVAVIRTEEIGTVVMVPVGMVSVGSVIWTVEEGQMVAKGQELGYFAMGGSSIVVAFEPRANFAFSVPEDTVIRQGEKFGVAAPTKTRKPGAIKSQTKKRKQAKRRSI